MTRRSEGGPDVTESVVTSPAPIGARGRMGRIPRAAIHLCVWGVLGGFPLASSPDPRATAWLVVPGVAALAAVFYLDYLVLVPWLLVRRKLTWAWFAANLALFAGMQAVMVERGMGFLPPPPSRSTWTESTNSDRMDLSDASSWEVEDPWEAASRPQPRAMLFAALPGLLFLAISAGVAAALRLYAGLNEETRRRRDIQTEFLRHELTYLRLQLGPHFLFNTLNNIYSLIQSDASGAQTAVLDLSRMLRYQLYEAQAELVSLGSEIDFMRSYVALMGLRLPPHATVDFKVQEGMEALRIAPLLFLPLVENAFKHGIHPTRPGAIVIELSRDDDRLRLAVSNPNHSRSDADRTGSGIGIANLRKRLGLLYDGTHRLNIVSDSELHIASLWIGVSRGGT
jgi:Histidine kinase